MIDYTALRRNMVDCQLRPNRVTDEGVLSAMGTVPRELFVPAARAGIAYVDADLEIDGGRFLMEPMVFGRLLQAAEVNRTDVGLVIGCATGYSAAVLGRLAGTVVALEREKNLAERANALLLQLGADNVAVVEGPLEDGYAAQAPYDFILLDGAVPKIPERIVNQIGPGGCLVGVVVRPGEAGKAMLVRRVGDALVQRILFDASAPRLSGFELAESFVF